MIHGPCGVENMNCPCMIDGKCSKKFPKKFRESTCIDGDGFPVYRRRNNGAFIEKSDVKLDNRSVVPYNKILLQRYQAHVNVEWCNQAGSIKYLFKYINKGHDRASICFVPSKEANDQEKTVDEIKDYYSCRYISACEASWRIFSYDIHYRNPSVIRLPFHLPGQQHVIYEEFEEIEDVLDKPSVNASMFLQCFLCNQKYPAARQLTYVEFPTKFVWKSNKRKWKPRKRGFSIGRIHSVSPSVGEAYYLRILLNKVKGPRNFEDIRTVNDVEYPTFRDACYAYGLLDDDNEYVEAIIEASFTGSGYYLRSLFCTMLMSESMSRPEFVWEKTFTYLSDDILYKQRRILKHPGLVLNEDQIKNLTLFEIQKFLLRNNSTLKRYSSMPFPNHDCISSANNLLLSEELAYDKEILAEEFRNLFSSLTHEQRVIYEEIITAVDNNKGGVFFVYGYGGTGKTYLWKTLCASIRSEGKIVLSVASSGIASLLLSGGRTAHSRFHIPINLDEDSFCFIKPDSDLARLLQETSLIIWDEAPMVHKHGFEALDRSLKDLFRSVSGASSELPFGGKVIVFGGDFRQILPVVPGGSRQQIVNASLSSSYIWRTCKVLKLTKNLRLSTSNDPSEIQETTNFANWLLDIGEGNVGGVNDGNANLQIPEDLLIKHSSDPISELIEFVYPSLIYNFNEQNYFHQRAILAPTNDVVQEINDRMLSLFPGVEKEYLSSDSICPTEMVNENLDDTLCSPDILNGIKASGLPNHRLVFKVGVPVMLLRNIDQKSGLCNGTRLKVVSLGKRVIQVEIISGSHIGDRHYIPRITLIPTDKKLHIKLQRRQFPLAVSFAMTINKSQGQSLSRVGLFLKNPVFTHGQLYVALSRVTRRDGLKIVILDSDGNLCDTTSNVVYKEVFRNL
ncbi:putative DNA helicase [Helianthus annuus]|nr:putative DNA helicase [Helianthus annuus]